MIVGLLAGVAFRDSGSSAWTVIAGIALDSATTSFAAQTTAILYFDLHARLSAPRRSPDPGHLRPRNLD